MTTQPQGTTVRVGELARQSAQDALARTAEARAQIKELENQLAQAIARNNILQEQVIGLRSQTNLSQADQARSARLQAELISARGEVQSLEARIDGARARIAAADVGVTVQAPQAVTIVPPVLPFTLTKEMTAITGIFTMFVLGPLAIAFAVRLIRRGPTANPAQLNDMAERMRRIETAVDTIAVEVERVSESQRFLTRSLSDPAKRAND